MAGGAAHAQTAGGISNIQGSAGSSVLTDPGSDPTIFGPGPGSTGAPPGASFDSFVNVTPSVITFESGNTSSSPSINTNSFSTVSFDVNNNTGHSVTFNSTITAAGLGFYLADTSGGCLYSNCPQVAPSALHTFADLGTSGTPAAVGFNFTVSRAATFDNAATTLFSLDGTLSMGHLVTSFVNPNLSLNDNLGSFGDGPNSPGTGARSLLNFGPTLGDDFSPTAGIGAATAIGFAWDATDISFNIGNFQNQTLVYTTQVFSTSSAPCIGATGICLVAYSGFGDPVGRGGGISSFATPLGFASFGSLATPLIQGVNFGPSSFKVPTLDAAGNVVFTAGVPEPATWMSMILGFGLLGAALRRRRVLAYN